MLSVEDLTRTLAWRNDSRSRAWFHSSAIIDWASHRSWYDAYLERPDDHVFVVEIEGAPAAQVSLYGIANGSGEFGRLVVDPERRGEGIGGLASRLCLRVADDVLRLEYTHLEVIRTNLAAIRIYRSLGFDIAHSDCAPDSSLYMVRSRLDRASPA
ncbi:GNAT family N-acetyltransferase [Pseudolysinimonas sp.]|uniref:GNAT family N-acetyltransferase n=1 Tax=Pseudolysinimonas sp. TaxID=2680009 RepID=UPI003F7F7830